MIQKVELNRGQVITKDNIRTVLNRAKGNYDYAKFNTASGKYITVTFSKDNKFEIATNYRDYTLFYDIRILKTTYNFNALVDFIFKWISKFVRM